MNVFQLRQRITKSLKTFDSAPVADILEDCNKALLGLQVCGNCEYTCLIIQGVYIVDTCPHKSICRPSTGNPDHKSKWKLDSDIRKSL